MNIEQSSQRNLWILLLGAVLIGILSFLAIFWRSYSTMTLNAKTSEATKNLQEICQAEQEYFRTHGVYVKAGPIPAREPSTSTTQFESPHLHEWNVLKWEPEWEVRCQYTIFLTKSDGRDFQAISRCDADGDGDYAQFQTDKSCVVIRISDKWVF